MSRNDRATKQDFLPFHLRRRRASPTAQCGRAKATWHLPFDLKSYAQIEIKLQSVADLVTDPATRDIGGR